jgi:hypothetical protein
MEKRKSCLCRESKLDRPFRRYTGSYLKSYQRFKQTKKEDLNTVRIKGGRKGEYNIKDSEIQFLLQFKNRPYGKQTLSEYEECRFLGCGAV